MKTGILLMTYRRPENTFKILKIFKQFNQKNIIVFNDGLKSKQHIKDHRKTRQIILNLRKQ